METMKTIVSNRKARHEYTIVETVEAGIALSGTEVKSLREGRANMTDTYGVLDRGQVILRGLHISPYSHTSQTDIDPRRDRKLLLHKREIRRLIGKVREKGLTLVPLKLYFNERGIAKTSLGLARGKNKSDKRDTLRRRDDKREIERAMRRRR